MYTDSDNLDGVVSRLLPNGFIEVRLADGFPRVCFAGPELRKAGTVLHEGDRVVLGAEEHGVFRGEIKRVKPALRAERERPAPRASLMTRSAPDDLRPEDQKVDRGVWPDWPTAAERAPQVGDVVYCTAGLGTVLRVLGRTGNGSRLLELRVPAGGTIPFFASGANVLLGPRQEARDEAAAADAAASGIVGGGR